MKYVLSILLVAMLLVPVGLVRAATIPTFAIVSVTPDASVTIQTANFPANRTFTVRMGAYGTLGINGTVVGTTESGAGGKFTATYDIPAGLKGSGAIAIRMDATSGGYYAYNWFYNSAAAPAVTPTPAATGIPGTGGYTGFPSFNIQSVVKDTSVTIQTKNFPANTTFTARMGAYGTLGINGTVVGSSESGKGGAYTVTFDIPASLKGAGQIAIRLEAANGYYAYNWFYNNTAP